MLGSKGRLGSELILFSDLEHVAGQNYTSGQARVTTCVSFSCWTVDAFSNYVIKGWVRALVENI